MSTHTYTCRYRDGKVKYGESHNGEKLDSSKYDHKIDRFTSKLECKIYQVSFIIAIIILIILVIGIVYSVTTQ